MVWDTPFAGYNNKNTAVGSVIEDLKVKRCLAPAKETVAGEYRYDQLFFVSDVGANFST